MVQLQTNDLVVNPCCPLPKQDKIISTLSEMRHRNTDSNILLSSLNSPASSVWISSSALCWLPWAVFSSVLRAWGQVLLFGGWFLFDSPTKLQIAARDLVQEKQ